jgi:hypothetical protein
MYTGGFRQGFVLTGVVGLVRVLLALVETGLLLLLGDLRVLVGSLVLGLVDTRVTDVGSSRHVD